MRTELFLMIDWYNQHRSHGLLGGPKAGRGLLPSVSRESSSSVRTKAWMAAWLPMFEASRAGRWKARR
jgi:hypothetical protein